MHHRVSCPHGCQGTTYKVGVTTIKMHGELVDVCQKHKKPVTKIGKMEMNGGHRFAPPKKPPGMVRRMMAPFAPALTR